MTLPLTSSDSDSTNAAVTRTYDERVVMSLLRQYGSLQEADIVQRSGLSAQTVSRILDDLEEDALLLRQDPPRGAANQQDSAAALNPDGAYSIGLKIGRRTSELVLMDFAGAIRASASRAYAYPLPDAILDFLQSELPDILDVVPAALHDRISGIGVAMPFELWNWAQAVGQGGSADAGLADWKQIDVASRIAELTKLPVHVQNDATTACRAELTRRHAPELSNFAYFFIGYFIGGGIVVDHAVYSGPTGNAGALGSLPIAVGRHGSGQLLDKVSLASLEFALTQQSIDPSPIWVSPNAWTTFGPVLDQWIEDSANYLAQAALTCCSVIDFQAIIIDGAFPQDVRNALVEKTASVLETLNTQGLARPDILAGSVGHEARSLGAATLPMSHRYFIDQNVLSATVNQTD